MMRPVVHAQSFKLGPLDCANAPGLYRGQILCFEGEELDVKTLRDGLVALIALSPLLTGTVTAVGPSAPGWYQVSQTSARSVDDILVVANMRHAMNYAVSRARGFPPSDFLSDFNPGGAKTILASSSAPVMAAQVNVVRGGVIVSIFMHHGVFDAPGSATVLRKWAALCRSERVAPLDIDRMPFSLDAGRGRGRMEDRSEYRLQAVDAPPPSFPPSTTGMWYFSAEALKRLRKEAAADDDDDCRLSTNDVLNAFLWMRVTAARVQLGRLHLEDETAWRCLVDARSRVIPRVSEEYTGNATIGASTKLRVGTLVGPDASLSTVARAAHTGVRRGATDACVRDSIACLSHHASDLRVVGLQWKDLVNSSLRSSSWARLDTYGLDWGAAFGHGKRCDRIRHPWDLICGMVVVMPRGAYGEQDTGFEVAIPLVCDQFEVLARDPVLAEYAERVY
ncbi:hypothetical protein EXIGLDRAFT_717490 [Exidia glandulosa HHB12029]|uniref:Transferase n=1 Tax=Exidia glandulosa HHB12029 TaxID=1314781 RepID=A0A165IDN5_EXIGL|nr:hypothetical protein EXIGLDRAFT_717490 [Exidia glandulosa HHB12029]